VTRGGEERRRGGEEEGRRGGEVRRGGEEERRRDLLLFTRVLSDCTCVLLAFTRVFKWYRLKPMHFQAGYVDQMLKPMLTATKKQLEPNRMVSKALKPMRIAATIARKPAARSWKNFLRSAPALRRHLSHTHTASPRPPRTNELKWKPKSKSIARSRASDKPD
jgi:hypothetical protein